MGKHWDRQAHDFDGRPKVGEVDELLAALFKEFGEDYRNELLRLDAALRAAGEPVSLRRKRHPKSTQGGRHADLV